MANQQLYYTFEDKKYPIFTAIDRNGNLTQVKGIPLKCPTCPNVPRFKDISHLITHYGSRDHLKAANETKVRHDLGIPESIRVYTLYQLWETHNRLWHWLIESHRRKAKLNEVKKEEDFPEYQPPVPKAKMEDPRTELPTAQSPPSSAVNSAVAPLPTTPQASAQISMTLRSASGRVIKPDTRAKPEKPSATSSGPAIVQDQTPPQSGKRPRGRPRKYPLGSKPKPIRRSMPNRRPPAPKQVVELVLQPPNDPELDPGIEFPVDPLAPKAKPLRLRRVKRDSSGSHPDEAYRPGPTLKGKRYPGMAVYDFGNMPKPDKGVNVLITAADQQTLPFDLDGHILRFDDDDDDSVWVQSLEEFSDRPTKRAKKDESDESFNFSTSTENEEPNESVNISASTRSGEECNENTDTICSVENDGVVLNAHPSFPIFNEKCVGNKEDIDNDDTNNRHPSFTILEDNCDDDKENSVFKIGGLTSTSSSPKRQPLRELDMAAGITANQLQYQPRFKISVQHHSNEGNREINDIHQVDLRQQNPFGQLNTQTPNATFNTPVLPRHHTMRTYEGLSADGPSLGWQGSFITSSRP